MKIQAGIFLLGLLSQVNAFGVQGPSSALTSRTALHSAVPEPKKLKPSYGEDSRKFRRTVYTHDDWVKHRSPDRFIRNLGTITKSGVYKSVGKELAATTVVATIVFLWNIVFGGYTDLSGIQHDAIIQSSIIPKLGLPLAPLTLSSSALGLLLVFRTNTGYQRWDEARKNWGMNINHTRDLVRMATAYYDPNYLYVSNIESQDEKSAFKLTRLPPSERLSPEEEMARRKEDLKQVSLATWSFVRAMKRHLSPEGEDEQEFIRELREKLPLVQAQAIINAAHRPNRALFDLSVAIENLPMNFLRKNQIHQAVTIFEDNLGSSERLLTSPVPLVYSRHTSRFLSIWLLFVPLALYEPFAGTWNHVGMIPATFFISLFFFGIDELAIQLEEPFTILPMQAFCDKIYNWCNEIVSWVPGDTDPFYAESQVKGTGQRVLTK